MIEYTGRLSFVPRAAVYLHGVIRILVFDKLPYKIGSFEHDFNLLVEVVTHHNKLIINKIVNIINLE